MKRSLQGLAALLCILVVLAVSRSADASSIVKHADERLVDVSAAIVAGRVAAISSGWDTSVNTIYSYITIDVDDVLKGGVSESRIVLKQAGGMVNEIGLEVEGQARFRVGERVLVFTEIRPRDRTLYTAGLWQGKWTVETDAASGRRVAVRIDPSEDDPQVERRDFDTFVAAIASRAQQDTRVRWFDVNPADAAVATNVDPFVLLSSPTRWETQPVTVDIQAGGDSRLAGGGFSQIAADFAAWNSAGASFAYSQRSSSAASRCGNTFGSSGIVTMTFNDPCAEVENGTGVLALAFNWFTTAVSTTVNGQAFRRTLEVVITTNDGSEATPFFQSAPCLQQVLLHELGHALGLGHTSVSGAIMFASVSFSQCSAGARPLHADDIAGVQFIYPGGTTPPPGGTTPPSTAPTNLQVLVNGTVSITVSFAAVPNDVSAQPSAATSYRLDFYASATGPVLTSLSTTTTTTTIAIPPGIVGTFFVSATGLNSAGAGPTSARVAFTIGGGPGCTAAPPAPTGLTFTLANNVITLNWTASAGATEYIVQAGSTAGAANFFNGSVGALTTISSPVPAGFSAFVQVLARNACGISAPSNVIQFTNSGGAPPPGQNFDGVWNGTSSQGRPFSFTISNNVVTSVRISVQGTNCTSDSTVQGSLGSVSGNTVSFNSQVGLVRFSGSGQFTSSNTAAGTLSFTFVEIPFVPSCTGSGSFSWTAGR